MKPCSLVLRREGFYSVRFGSDTGETGAAAVLLDGQLISADVMLAAQADSHEIETVEGLATPLNLHPIQQAFIATGAIQSGYATPAMIMATKQLLDRNPNPSEEEIRDTFSGILDRETGYLRPVSRRPAGCCPDSRPGGLGRCEDIDPATHLRHGSRGNDGSRGPRSRAPQGRAKPRSP